MIIGFQRLGRRGIPDDRIDALADLFHLQDFGLVALFGAQFPGVHGRRRLSERSVLLVFTRSSSLRQPGVPRGEFILPPQIGKGSWWGRGLSVVLNTVVAGLY